MLVNTFKIFRGVTVKAPFLLVFCFIQAKTFAFYGNEEVKSLEKLNNDELKAKLTQDVSVNHRPISYKRANEILFLKLDNQNGQVCSVYSKDCVEAASIPSPKIMNVEHTWPQSLGAHGEAKADLHHLYPTNSNVNSIRSSLPFCDVKTIKWEGDLSRRGESDDFKNCFEPPQTHKGNVARSLFYFAIRYKHIISEAEEKILRKWHQEDPVDQNEEDRNLKINIYQKNKNPFVENPELVDLVEDF